MDGTLTLRLATAADSDEILNIYAPYVRDTAISFELEPPAAEEFRGRVERISGVYPYIVCLDGGVVVGYAYASRFRERAAYDYDVESSIYIKPEYHRRGIAGRLYGTLIRLLAELNYRNVYAGIALPNDRSLRLHQSAGFHTVGVFTGSGFKFNKWHDVIWLEKQLNDFCEAPGPVRSMGALPAETIAAALDFGAARRTVAGS